MQEKVKYLGKNTLVFAISSFGTKFLAFFLVPLYTNVLSTDEYGASDLITTTASLLMFILTINISDSVLRYTLERKSKQDEILSYGFRVLIIGSSICILGLGIFSLLNIVNWPLYYYLFIFLCFFTTTLYQILSNYLRGIDLINNVAVAGIVSSCTIILSNILFLLVFKLGNIGYLISMVLGPGFAIVYCLAILKLPIKTFFVNSCDKETQKLMRSFCVPLIFNNIAIWINAFLDRYFVTYYRGVGENGIYSVAGKIPTILSTCYIVFSQAWNLSAIKEFDPEDSDGFFSKTYSTYNSLITVVCSILILLNYPLAHFLYAKEFFDAWHYSSVLLIATMFNSLTVILGSIFSAVKKTQVTATTTIISAVINTVLNIILIQSFGAIGAAIATVTAYFSMWAIRLILSRKYIKFKINVLRDVFVYAIIILQVILDHLNGHFYYFQIGCFLLIVIIYWKYLSVFAKTIFSIISSKFFKIKPK